MQNPDFKPLSDFEHRLLLERQVKELVGELKNRGNKIGELQSTLEEAKYHHNKEVEALKKSVSGQSRKITELQQELKIYERSNENVNLVKET